MKGSPCCAGLMQSCLHTYRTKTNLTQHIIQPWGGGIRQVWGGHQSSMGGSSAKYGGGHQSSMGGVINQLWEGVSAKYGGVSIFPPVCTGSQNPQNYFSNTYVLPSVNRTAGPKRSRKNSHRTRKGGPPNFMYFFSLPIILASTTKQNEIISEWEILHTPMSFFANSAQILDI